MQQWCSEKSTIVIIIRKRGAKKLFYIGICDSNDSHLKEIKQCLQAILFDQCEFEIAEFYDPRLLINELNKNRFAFDLIFTETEFDSLDGFDIAGFIRKNNINTDIIFITGNKSGALKGYEYNAFDYLVKPVSFKKMASTIERYFDYKDTEKKYIYIKYNSTVDRINTDRIYYFYSTGRKVHIVEEFKNLEFYGKLDDVMKALNESFVRIHQSYIVNLNHVRSFSREYVQLENNDLLPISKKYCDEIRLRFKDKVLVIA